jgi:hypothetical protein
VIGSDLFRIFPTAGEIAFRSSTINFGFSQTGAQSLICARDVTLSSQATAATLGKYLR